MIFLWSTYFYGLVQDCGISSALALEIPQPCIKLMQIPLFRCPTYTIIWIKEAALSIACKVNLIDIMFFSVNHDFAEVDPQWADWKLYHDIA